MKVLAFAALAAAFNSKYAPPSAGSIGSLSASAAPSSVGSIEAAAVRPYGVTAGKLVYVKATDHFYVPGPTLVPAGDYVQVTEADANDLVRREQAVIVTDAEAADAAKANSKVK